MKRETFSRVLMAAVVFSGAPAGQAVAQTGNRFELARAEARANYNTAVADEYTEMHSDLGRVRDLPRGVVQYLQTQTDLRLCEYNPARGPFGRMPTMQELTRTDAIDDRYSFSPRSDFLARQEYAREDARDIITDACEDVRRAGIQREEQLSAIRIEEAEARIRGQ